MFAVHTTCTFDSSNDKKNYMKTVSNRHQHKDQYIKLVMIVLLTVLGAYSCSVHAQQAKAKYLGLEGSFGDRSFTLASDIKKIDNLRGGHLGGSIGVVTGNEILKARLKAGYYFSNSNNPHTQDIYETSGTVNFYPLEFIRKHPALFHPYISVGTSLSAIKYYGNYLSSDPYSGQDELYLGKIVQYKALGGIGVEMRLETERDFVHFFAEGQFEKSFKSTQSEAFNNTTTHNITSFNVGVSFGRKKFN
jgi:hypothetical protein